jgi:PDZ domain-containing protein
VVAGAPAAGRLEPADRILEADGQPVHSMAQVRAAITAHRVGQRVTFEIERQGRTSKVPVPVERVEGEPRVGILLRDLFPDLPVKVSITTLNNIGGPSAGLMFTLSIIDKLTPEDLTGGRRIAGTGEIDLEGGVGPVGGVAEKLVAVHRLGVTTFFIPAANCPDVRGRVPRGLRLVKVSKVGDALAFLRDPKVAATAPGC